MEKGSVHHGPRRRCAFRVTDGARAVPIDFNGVLPALFREGQGVVATGALNAGGTFDATEDSCQARREIHAAGSGRRVEALAAAGRKAGSNDRRAGPICTVFRVGAVAGDGGRGPGGRDADRRNVDLARRGRLGRRRLGFLVFVALAFGTLTYGFVTSDFSASLDVANNSPHPEAADLQDHRRVGKPRRLHAAVGAGAVASMPRWWRSPQRGGARLTSRRRWACRVCSRRRSCCSFFSPPIRSCRIDPAPFEGAGLNPLLQDPGLAMHPPMLYLGLCRSFGVIRLCRRRADHWRAKSGWARAARPFMLVAWIALTCGIALGSWWAYYELGWGGFWFWDPVENASLMPWLVATALLHSALATERSGAFRTWTLLLAIAGFSLSLIGTFLVRSGVLSSVHAFATDPTRGFFIMVLIAGCAIGGALALFAWRAPTLAGRRRVRHASAARRCCCSTMCFWWRRCACVFVGTLYPLVLDAMTGSQDFGGTALLSR